MRIRPGLRPARYDSRDYIYIAREPPENTANEVEVIIDHDVPVIDQGKIVPCCVSIAVTTCMEVLDKNGATPLSFMYNYHLARPGSSRLSTLEIRDGLTAAALYGICTKALHDVELNREGANTTPSQAADDEAITRRIGPSLSASDWAYEHFESDNRIAHWRNAIQIGVPVIMGFYLTESYHNISINNNTHARPLNEVGSDGHAVTVMGYNDKHDNGALSPGAFYVRDSRGDDFGDKGYWWLPYELVKAHMIVDSWTVIDVTQY